MHAFDSTRIRDPDGAGERVAARLRYLAVSFCWALLVGDGTAQAQQGPGRALSGDDFICTSPTERREIRVIPGCRVDYIKNHMTATLWSSHDPAYCAAKAAGLVTTLVKANFSCKTETTAADAD